MHLGMADGLGTQLQGVGPGVDAVALLDGAESALCPMTAKRLASVSLLPGRALPLLLHGEAPELCSDVLEASHFLFQIVDKKPSDIHTTKLGPGTQGKVGKDDLAVTVHHATVDLSVAR